MRDYYAILGIPRDATAEEIKRAYLEAARRLHPDKNILPGETELFLEVQQAYEVLSNPKRRAEYDATLPPQEEPPFPLRVSTLYSRAALPRLDDVQILYTLTEIALSSGTESQRALWNVALVVDRSTSMQGEKLETVKKAVLEWLEHFAPQDLYSLITFSDRAEVVLPSSVHRSSTRARSQIYAIQAGGGTEIYQGLRAGYDEVLKGYSPERINQLILLTDGQTYGDEEPCLQLAAEAAEKGILISALGLGSDWNDAFLDRLTSLTGGSAHFAASANDVVRLLKQLLEQSQRAYAEETALEFSLAEGVEISYLFRIHPDTSPLPVQSPLRLGILPADDVLSFLAEFRIRPEALRQERLRLLTGQLRVMPLGGDPLPPLPLHITRTVTDEPDASPPPAPLVQALSRITLYRLQDQAQQQAQRGEYAHATRTLHHLASHLLGQGERNLARTILLEAERLQREGQLSEEGKKTIKYGTRALISSASLPEEGKR